MAPLGSLIGFAACGVFALNVDTEDPIDCMDRLKEMVWWQNGIFSVLCILYILLAREKPKSPPSQLALTFKQLS